MRLIAWILTVIFALAGLALRDDQGWFNLGPNLTELFAKGLFGLALLSCPFLWARSYGFMPRGLQVPGGPRLMAGLAMILAIPLVLPWH